MRKGFRFLMTINGPMDQWKGEFCWSADSLSGHGPLDQWKGEFCCSTGSLSGHGLLDHWKGEFCCSADSLRKESSAVLLVV